MPAGQVIGRVSVKVLPDTDDFRRQAQRDLDRIEKTLKVTVQAKIDLTAGVRDALVELRRINQENRVNDGRKMRIYTTIATSTMDAEITKAVRKLQEKADGRKIRINADLVGAVVATDLDEESLKRVEHKLKDWANDISPLKVQVELDMAAGAGARVSARLAVLTRPRTVPILPVVNDGALAKAASTLAALSGARVVTKYLTDLWRVIQNLDRSAPIITALALAIAGLGASGIAAASNLAALSASLASIFPLVLALPGLLGGAALGIAATVVAFKDFNQVLPEVKTRLSGLADLMSGNFWGQAEKPIRALVDSLLPEFSAGLAKVSTELGGFFAGLATAFSGVFDGALAGMFADLSASITIATGATAALASIIRVLGETGAGYLPELAQWFVNITNSFNAFLSAAAADGRLTGWIDTAVTALHDLGGVLASLGSIFAGVAAAATAAGGSVLGTLAVALEHVAAVVNSPTFQTSLTGVFAAAHQAMNLIATQSGPAVENLFTQLAATLQTVLPVAGQAIGTLLAGIASALAHPAFQNGLLDLFAGIRDAATALAPALGPVGVAFGALGSVIGTFVATLGPTLATVFTALANVVAVLAPALQPLITLLGGALQAALTSLAPIIGQVTTALTSMISGGLVPALASAFTGLAPVVGALGGLLGTVLVTALNAITPLLPIIAQLITAIAPVIAGLLTSLAPIIGQLLTAVAPLLGVIVQALTPLITMLLQLVTSVVTPLLQVLGDAIASVLPGLGVAFAGVAAGCQPLLEMLQKVVDFLLPFLVPAVKFLATTLLENLVVAINAVVDVFKAAVKIIQGVWDIFAGLFTGDWGRVWKGIQEVFGGVWDAITAVLSAALTMIGNGLRNAMSFSTGLWSSTWNNIRSTFSAVWNTITATAANAWNDMRSEFVTGVALVLATVAGLPGRARAALGNLGNILISAGRQLIAGFIDGITAMFGQVRNALGNLTSLLPDWKGPQTTDRVLLTDAGRIVMDGFITGLESRYGAVRKSLAGLTGEISSMTVRPPAIAGFDSSALAANVTAALSANGGAGTVQKILNYYAAPGSSIDSDEDLFTAAGRARMAW
jgi:phage-related protein